MNISKHPNKLEILLKAKCLSRNIICEEKPLYPYQRVATDKSFEEILQMILNEGDDGHWTFYYRKFENNFEVSASTMLNTTSQDCKNYFIYCYLDVLTGYKLALDFNISLSIN